MSVISGKVILITGGLGGIGSEVVKELLKNGAKGVTVLDLPNAKKENELHTIAAEHGVKVVFLPTDVTKSDQIEAAFEKTIDVFQHLDIVFNIAGILNETIWKTAVNINLVATMEISYLAVKKYFPKYAKGNEAYLVNIASIAGLMSFLVAPAYCATKYGLVGFGKSLGEACAAENSKIKVITICPGFTNTPILANPDFLFSTQTHIDIFKSLLTKVVLQEPACVGPEIVKVLGVGESGSCWVIDGGESYEIEFKSYIEMKKKH